MSRTHAMPLVFTKSLQFLIILSLAVVIPFLFHFTGLKGDVFLPIYTAVAIGAFVIDPLFAVAAALITPIANYLVTGMPAYTPFPMLEILMVELAVLGLSAGIARKLNFSLLAGVVIAILLARVSSLIFVPFTAKVTMQWWANHFMISIPGILLNMAVAFIAGKVFNERS